jgi:3-ketosteroid 9alpha-monooxygenase subunit B
MATESARSRPTALQTYDSVITEIITETPDTKTLVLDIGTTPIYTAGQYLTIDPHQFAGLKSMIGYLEQLKGRKEPPRAYSMCSAPHEPRVAITIKEELYAVGAMEYPPLISGFLVHHLHTDLPMVVKGFIGTYILKDDIESRTDHILHLCAGSGSVPNVSMIKDSLYRHPRLRHTFIYSNKTWEDVIFRDELTALAHKYSSRLRVIHALTREKGALPEGVDVRHGRVTQDLLASVLSSDPESLIYMCGPAVSVWEQRACKAQGTTPPQRFIESMLDHLEALAVPKERIKLEAFG